MKRFGRLIGHVIVFCITQYPLATACAAAARMVAMQMVPEFSGVAA